MITLKHLARDYDYDPYKLRQLLRTHFGIRRRWRWDPSSPDDKAQLDQVKELLESKNVKS